MAKRARAGAEVDPVDDERGQDPESGPDDVRDDADAEPDFDDVESELDAITGESDEGDGADAGDDAAADGDVDAEVGADGAGDPAAEMADPAAMATQYTAEDAGYGEYKPDPAERQPGAPPYEFEHYATIGTDGLTDRGVDLYLAATNYNWPKPGKPIIMPDGDLYSEVGDSYPMLPVFTERTNY